MFNDNYEKSTKRVTNAIWSAMLTAVILLFLRPLIVCKALSILIAVCGWAIPVFTYWQMFFLLWALSLICGILGKITHDSVKKEV